MMKKNGGIIAAFLLILFSLYVFFSSFSITSTANAALGPAFMPLAVSGILFILGCVNLYGEVKAKRLLDRETAVSETAGKQGNRKSSTGEFIAAHIDYISGLLLLVYVFTIKPLGFLISSCIYMFCHMLLLTVNTKRNYVVLILLTIIAPSIIYFGFVKIFYLMLPPGILG